MGSNQSTNQNSAYASALLECELAKRKYCAAQKELSETLIELEKARERIRTLEIILYDQPRD